MKHNPSFREGAVPHRLPTGLVVWRFEDLLPEVAARLLREAASPEFQAQLKAAAEKWPTQYAVFNASLPEDAMVMIIRDPEPGNEFTIFQQGRLTDRGMAVARAALVEDELAEPNLTARRTLLAWEDQTVKTGNVAKQMRWHFGGDWGTDAASMRPLGEEVLVPELGKIQLVK